MSPRGAFPLFAFSAGALPARDSLPDDWAFHPLERPHIPESRPTARVSSNPIDAFICAALDERGLKPSREADKRKLLRRVYFDLAGLPPSLEDLHAFLADNSPDAYERVVDRLLASPRYGERWARHW